VYYLRNCIEMLNNIICFEALRMIRVRFLGAPELIRTAGGGETPHPRGSASPGEQPHFCRSCRTATQKVGR